MIINKITKAFQTRSDKPNENWLNDSNYLVVDDNSGLAEIIKDNYPYIDLVIRNNILENVEVDVEGKERSEQQKYIQAEIEQLKQQLTNTDYKAIKYAEGQLTEEEYAETKAQRQLWRSRINELEDSL